jgi:hypothetical protein
MQDKYQRLLSIFVFLLLSGVELLKAIPPSGERIYQSVSNVDLDNMVFALSHKTRRLNTLFILLLLS